MAIKCRGKQLADGLHTGINTRHIVMASKMVFSCLFSSSIAFFIILQSGLFASVINLFFILFLFLFFII